MSDETSLPTTAQLNTDTFLQTQKQHFTKDRHTNAQRLNLNLTNPLNITNNAANTIISGNTFTIATHNVQSLKDPTKSKQILDDFKDKNIDIIGLTETRHNLSTYFTLKDDSTYQSFWSMLYIRNSGMGILIKKCWAKYIQK